MFHSGRRRRRRALHLHSDRPLDLYFNGDAARPLTLLCGNQRLKFILFLSTQQRIHYSTFMLAHERKPGFTADVFIFQLSALFSVFMLKHLKYLLRTKSDSIRLNQTKSDSIRLNQTLTEGKSLCISLNDKLLSLYLKTCLHDNRWRSVRERKLPQHQRSHRQRHRDCQDPVISTNTVKCICGKNAPESSFRLGLLPRAVTQNSGAMVTESLWAPFTSFIQLCGQLHWLLGHELLTADRSVARPWVSAHFDLLCFYHRAVHSLTTVTRVLLGLLSWRMNSFLCFHWIFYDSCEIKSSKNVKSVF